MKQKNLLLAVLISAATLADSSATALTDLETRAIQTKILEVRLPELPARAEAMVAGALDDQKSEVAVAILKAVLPKHPATAPLLVTAIIKVAPQTSALVAATAAELVPAETIQIARAAAKASPQQSAQVASAVSKVAPKRVMSVAEAVVTAVPASRNEVVASVSATVPSAAPRLEAFLARSVGQAAHDGGTHGTIIVTPGRIGGGSLPSTPTAATASPGFDPARYGSP
jgi:hypothetical protein